MKRNKLFTILLLVIISLTFVMAVFVACKPLTGDLTKNNEEVKVKSHLKIYNSETNEVYIDWYGYDIELIIEDDHLEAYNYKDDNYSYYYIVRKPNIVYELT